VRPELEERALDIVHSLKVSFLPFDVCRKRHA